MNLEMATNDDPASPPALAATRIACSGMWLVAACEYLATSGLGLDWSATPLPWMMAVVLTPALCFAGCMVLLDRQKRTARRFSPLEWWALSAAFLPVTLGSLLSAWAVRVLVSMSGT